jgi:hypothetical protein
MPLTKIQSLGITDGTIVNADINASAAIDASKLTGVGKVLQVVQTVKTDTFNTSSTTFTDITGLSASITPSSTSNKILVMCHIGICGAGGDGVSAAVALIRGSTNIGGGTTAGGRLSGISRTASGQNSDHGNGLSFQYLDSPATTSSTTYKIQTHSQTSFSVYVNRSGNDADVALSYGTRTSSTLTLIEIAA